jgi:hypothetical protein
MRLHVILALVFLLAPMTLSKADAQPTPTPVPYVTPDLTPMQYFVGTWSCHSKLRGSDRPSTLTYRVSDDKHWIKFREDAPPFDRYRTQTIVSDGSLTYNPTAKQWAFVVTDNFGGYGISTSPGWNGNRLIFTDVVTDNGSMGTFTMDKVANDAFHTTVVVRSRDGKTDTIQGDCKKSG